MSRLISEVWKSIPATLGTFSSDNHALVAFSLILVSTVCVLLFYNAPIWPRLLAFAVSAGFIVGAAMFIFVSSFANSQIIEVSDDSQPDLRRQLDQDDVTRNTICVVNPNDAVKCWPTQ